jgi:hypothetical protein
MPLSSTTTRRQLWNGDKYFKMKVGSIGEPDFHRGAKLKLVQLENGELRAVGLQTRRPPLLPLVE